VPEVVIDTPVVETPVDPASTEVLDEAQVETPVATPPFDWTAWDGAAESLSEEQQGAHAFWNAKLSDTNDALEDTKRLLQLFSADEGVSPEDLQKLQETVTTVEKALAAAKTEADAMRAEAAKNATERDEYKTQFDTEVEADATAYREHIAVEYKDVLDHPKARVAISARLDHDWDFEVAAKSARRGAEFLKTVDAQWKKLVNTHSIDKYTASKLAYDHAEATLGATVPAVNTSTSLVAGAESAVPSGRPRQRETTADMSHDERLLRIAGKHLSKR
jgi:hypothetical protein